MSNDDFLSTSSSPIKFENNTNFMEQVAKFLNIEIGQEFKIKFKDIDRISENIYMLKTDGLYVKNIYNTWITAASQLQSLLNGTYSVVPSPIYSLKIHELYYYPDITQKELVINSVYNCNNIEDLKRYENGLVCKTKEQAEELGKLLITTAKDFNYV